MRLRHSPQVNSVWDAAPAQLRHDTSMRLRNSPGVSCHATDHDGGRQSASKRLRRSPQVNRGNSAARLEMKARFNEAAGVAAGKPSETPAQCISLHQLQ